MNSTFPLLLFKITLYPGLAVLPLKVCALFPFRVILPEKAVPESVKSLASVSPPVKAAEPEFTKFPAMLEAKPKLAVPLFV